MTCWKCHGENDALMPVGAGELRQSLVVSRVDRAMHGLGPGHEVAHPGVAPHGGEMKRLHGLRPLPQAGIHGVESEQGTGGGHGLGARRRPTNTVLCAARRLR